MRNKIYDRILHRGLGHDGNGRVVERPLPSESKLHGPRGDPRGARSRLDLPARGAAPSQAIAGLGGVGKTQTAVEYAYRHREQYRAVLWVRADTEASIAFGYRALAEMLLGLPEEDAKRQQQGGRGPSATGSAASRTTCWSSTTPTTPPWSSRTCPSSPTGHVLLTSRAHNFEVLGIRKPIRLPVLEPDEAREFLGKRTDREASLDPAEWDAVRTLAGELGYLPLALEQAAAYMVEHEEPFSVFLAAYRALRMKLLDEMGPVAGEYPETVRTTWKRSFDAVVEASPASIELLRLSAFFAPDAIPYELILEGASELGELLAPALASPPGGDLSAQRAPHPAGPALPRAPRPRGADLFRPPPRPGRAPR